MGLVEGPVKWVSGKAGIWSDHHPVYSCQLYRPADEDKFYLFTTKYSAATSSASPTEGGAHFFVLATIRLHHQV